MEEVFAKIIQYSEILKGYSFWGNSLYNYALFVLVVIGLMIVLRIFQGVVLVKMKKIAEKTENTLDDAFIDTLRKIRSTFYFFVALYFGLQFLFVPENVSKYINIVILFALAYEVVRSVGDLVDYFIQLYVDKAVKTEKEKKQAHAMMRLVRFFVFIVLWSIILLLILSNLGINVTSIVASLGIGGIAIALAVQNILNDVFSSFSIFLDKPFEVGDFIIIGEDSGTVEHIGLKTTRLRTLRGEVLVISNKELTTARVKNLRRLRQRRDTFMLALEYELSAEKREKVPMLVKKIIEKVEKASFDRCHLFEFGPSSLNYEVVYLVDSADYDIFMDVRQEINLAIMKTFEKEKIAFAYPTQKLYVSK